MMALVLMNDAFPDTARVGTEETLRDSRFLPIQSHMKPLAMNFQPSKYDVICARGKQALEHPGNQHLRALVDNKLDDYCRASSKIAKSIIVSEVVDSVREATSNGGFVKKVDGRWFEVGDNVAREKIGQTFRNLLHFKYKSSTKAKALNRKKPSSKQSISGKVVSSQPKDKKPPAINLAERKPSPSTSATVVSSPVAQNKRTNWRTAFDPRTTEWLHGTSDQPEAGRFQLRQALISQASKHPDAARSIAGIMALAYPGYSNLDSAYPSSTRTGLQSLNSDGVGSTRAEAQGSDLQETMQPMPATSAATFAFPEESSSTEEETAIFYEL